MRVSEPAVATEQGRGSDYDRLYERLQPSLWRYVHRLVGDADVTDDVVQETFVRLLSRPDLGGDPARLWVFTVATNLVRDRGRTKARRQRLLTAIPPVQPPAGLPDDRLDRNERVRAVRAALEQLSDRDRHLLLMREEGFKYHEIAEAVGVAQGSVGTLIARAVRKFTQIYTPVAE